MFEMTVGGAFSAEDLFIFERVQSTLEAGANDDFVLDRFEQPLRRFRGNVTALLAEDAAPGVSCAALGRLSGRVNRARPARAS